MKANVPLVVIAEIMLQQSVGRSLPQIGTFSVTTVAPFSDVANTRYAFNWTDVDTLTAAMLTRGLAVEAADRPMTHAELHALWNERTDELKRRQWGAALRELAS